MIAIISLLLVVFLSILITRIATIALTHTGLTRQSARFQARSAFSGAGFTTSESEMVVSHPVRRKIVMTLILIGNAGIVAAISTLILTFVQQGDTTTLTLRIVILVAGILVLWLLASSKWVDRQLSRIVDAMLKRYTSLDVRDYASLLHLTGEYRLAELHIRKDDWIAGRKLSESRLRAEGINLLGIKKPDGTYIGNPTPETRLEHKDNLLLYGRIEAIKELDRRQQGLKGDIEHHEAIVEQQQVLSEQEETREEKVSQKSGQ
ncbi:MAG TPA: TrkA C-terminal domain-containing protein [Desulfotignum sp.]|nr:TrkA C-terminal domain-containing protein [Desulfotignum sp.]